RRERLYRRVIALPDPAVHSPRGAGCTIDYAMTNSFGFGWANGCLVFKRWVEQQPLQRHLALASRDLNAIVCIRARLQPGRKIPQYSRASAPAALPFGEIVEAMRKFLGRINQSGPNWILVNVFAMLEQAALVFHTHLGKATLPHLARIPGLLLQ